MPTLAPSSEEELAETIRDAVAKAAPLRLVGSGAKAALERLSPEWTHSSDKKSLQTQNDGAQHALGRPAQGDALSLAGFSGVSLYEPDELVISAGAGTPRAEIEALLDAHGQQFAFEPIDYGPLLGAAPSLGSIGALVSIGASGPRRFKAGALRDHLLGFRCVTGRGEIVKSGGRVMKNVTGYDLSKLVCGAYGTLAALTEVTFKVLPKPETQATLLLVGRIEKDALAALRAVAASPCEASGLAVLPAGAQPLGLDRCAAAIRLEGPPVSVARRLDDLRMLLGEGGGAFETLEADASAALWRALRDAAPVAQAEGQVWRVSLTPTQGFAFVASLRCGDAPLLDHFYDWVGGLVWVRLNDAPDAHAPLIRACVAALGGHATLVRADKDVRSRVDVFQPQPPALAALTQRVKESFDPAHMLERGRMRAEF